MPSLLAILGLNASTFKAGLDKSVDQAKKAGGTIESNLLDRLKSSGVVQAIASPIGVASGLAIGFVGKIIAEIDELKSRAKEIKIGMAKTNLDAQQFQHVKYASEAVGADPDAAAKGIVKIAEAQEKVKRGGDGAAEALEHFTNLGITLDDIKSKGPQELFLQLADAMHVSQLSGEQMAAGAELLGKGFEALEPAFKRGFNDPLDQMKMLTDDEIKRLSNMNRNLAAMKSLLGGAFQNIATGAMDFFGMGEQKGRLGGDDDLEKGARHAQELLNKQIAAKAKAAAAGKKAELDSAKNFKEADKIEAQVAEEERLARLRSMTADQRLAELQKESGELEKQRGILLAKLKTEKDAASAPKIAALDLQLAKNRKEQAENKPKSAVEDLKLTANQQIGAFSNMNSANTTLVSIASKQEQHLASLVRLNEQMLKKPGSDPSIWDGFN